MAKITFKAGEDYCLKLSKLAARSDAIAKKAIYKGAGIVAEAIKSSLHDTVSDKATGDLENSIGISEMKNDGDGWNAKIGVEGYDRKGTPNALKARVRESGTSTRKKRPFVRPAVKKIKPKAESVMGEVINEEIEKTMKK